MARRKQDQLDTPTAEKGIGADKERVRALARERCEGRIDLAPGAGADDLDLQPHGSGGRLHVFHRGLGAHRIAKYGHTRCSGHQRA
jgi:hypothetical protein